MHRILRGGVLSALVALGLASAANAQAVQRSGNTYHVAACALATATVGHARCHAHIVTDAKGRAIESISPPIGGKTPANLQDAYKTTGLNGKSATIVAAVDAFGYTNAEADLGVYRSQWGLPACTTANGCFKKLNQRGKQGHYPPQNIGWADESALDLDMASAMCPNCQLWLVEADTNSLRHLAKAVGTAAALGAHVISNSYGGGDGGRTNAYESYYTQPGVAVTASTGDGGYGTSYPASSPHVTAVGGTHLIHDGSQRGWGESVWRGAGSGCSRHHDKPAWQTDPCPHRTMADVSAVADPATGVAVFGPNSQGNGTWLVFGGTSVSAPLVGGIYGNNGGSVNFGSNPYSHTDALYDVTTGTNGSCGNGPLGLGRRKYLCNGEVGYDGPTGLGTPNGTAAFGD
jgi:subtilase family serine protease